MRDCHAIIMHGCRLLIFAWRGRCTRLGLTGLAQADLSHRFPWRAFSALELASIRLILYRSRARFCLSDRWNTCQSVREASVGNPCDRSHSCAGLFFGLGCHLADDGGNAQRRAGERAGHHVQNVRRHPLDVAQVARERIAIGLLTLGRFRLRLF